MTSERCIRVRLVRRCKRARSLNSWSHLLDLASIQYLEYIYIFREVVDDLVSKILAVKQARRWSANTEINTFIQSYFLKTVSLRLTTPLFIATSKTTTLHRIGNSKVPDDE